MLFDDVYEAQLELLDIYRIEPTEPQRRRAEDFLRQLINDAIDAGLEAAAEG